MLVTLQLFKHAPGHWTVTIPEIDAEYDFVSWHTVLVIEAHLRDKGCLVIREFEK